MLQFINIISLLHHTFQERLFYKILQLDSQSNFSAILSSTFKSMFYLIPSFSSVSHSCPTLCDPWAAARHASTSITNSWSLLKLMSIEQLIPSKHFILCHPLLLCIQSFPASGSFPRSQFFMSGGQSIGVSASASVFPMNIQD